MPIIPGRSGIIVTQCITFLIGRFWAWVAEGPLYVHGLGDDPAANEAELWRQIAAVTRGGRVPAAAAQGFVDFQLTRGLLGVTT